MLDFASSILPKAGAHRRTLSSFLPEDSRSSSLQKVWAEDYFNDENSSHYQNQSEDLIAPPAPATLTDRSFGKNTEFSYDDEPATPRPPCTHQRSLTALLPFRTSRTNSTSPQRSPQRSPVKEKLDFDFTPTLTGDTDRQIKIADKSRGGLSGWFSGSSEPVAVGLPIDNLEDSIDMPFSESSRATSPDRGIAKLRKRPTVPTLDTAQQLPTGASTAPTSRFAFFSPKTAAPTQHQIPAELSDELLNLDVRRALFPAGENGPCSPAAFKNLLSNAEGLLNKLQTAYKIRTISLHELAGEKEAQAEELEEAETRAQHLKMQLEDMAQRVMAHDEEMKKVNEELNKERQARAEEKEAREKSINLIKTHTASPSEELFPHSEDLEVDSQRRRRPWRRSNGTINSETSFESDDESAGAESVFSSSMSPSLASVSEISMSEMGHAIFAKVVNVSPKRAVERPKTVQQRSTFQKILKSISATPDDESQTSKEKDEDDELGMADEGCRNCRGGQASVAWDTVGLLRAENKGLKERMANLETAVEGALDLVNGLRL
jgi:hypothetical protein